MTQLTLLLFAGVRDDNGKSPLDLAMERVYYSEGFLEVAHYLMSHGFDSDKETLAKLLCGACLWGKLAIVKDLVEQHKLDPKSESLDIIVCYLVEVLESMNDHYFVWYLLHG